MVSNTAQSHGMSRLAQALGLGLLAGVVFTSLSFLWVLQAFEWQLFDQWTRWATKARPISEDIALVVIDESSIEAMANDPSRGNPRWSWPRHFYADMITYLEAAGAREIWMDILFTEPAADAYEDDVLKAFAEASGKVRFASTEKLNIIFAPTFEADLADDEYGMVRRHSPTGGLLAWPGSYADAFGPLAEPAINLIIRGSELRKSYFDEADSFEPDKIRAFYDRLKNLPPPEGSERFRGKSVFLGATAAGTYDLKATPVGREPGVIIHATAFSNERTGVFIDEASRWQQVLLIFGACLAMGFVVFFLREVKVKVATGALILVMVLGGSWVLFLQGFWLPPVATMLGAATVLTVGLAINYWREGRHKRWIIDTFGNFLSDTVVARLIANPQLLQLGGKSQQATVLFSDLAGFTSLSEKMEPAGLVSLLNTYLAEMSELIIEHEGYLDKYIGDAIMAIFGVDPRMSHAQEACFAALDCHQRLAAMIPEIERKYGVRLVARIGINTGEMIVGMMGSARKRNYTVIGDAVNLASRLEGANKPYGTSILIGEETLQQAGSVIETRPVDKLAVKGKDQPLRVYELLSRRGELPPDQAKARDCVERGFDHYMHRRWMDAAEAYRQADELYSGDSLCQMFLNRIAAFEKTPPPGDWDGVFRLDSK